MEKIVIRRAEEILAHHTRHHPRSSYGQPIWVVERDEVEPGDIIWSQGDHEQTLYALGVVGGWLVVRQPNGVLAGIIWSDGNYFAGNIVCRATGAPARSESLDHLESGRYQVESALVADDAFMPGSPLGCVMS